jgi:hypothetical protein
LSINGLLLVDSYCSSDGRGMIPSIARRANQLAACCAVSLDGGAVMGGKPAARKNSFRQTFQREAVRRATAAKNSSFVFTEIVHHVRIPSHDEGRTRGRHDMRGGNAVDVWACSVPGAPTNELMRT